MMPDIVLYILAAVTLILVFVSAFLLVYFLRAKKTTAVMTTQLDNYNSIIDQANDAMLVIDIADGKIHQSNPSAQKLLEYGHDELLKLTLFNLHPAEYLQRSSAIVADVWEKGGLIYKDIPFVTRSGRLIPVECSATVAPFAGRPAVIIYARDITLRLKLENEILAKNKIIEEKNSSIQDSINYARRIQLSIFPTENEVTAAFNEHFILYKPLSIVSGDFYWMTTLPTETDSSRLAMLAVADCTGHGVPGALMSIVGNTLLNQTIKIPAIKTPAQVLDFLNGEFPKNLKYQKEGGNLRDGMDIVICAVDHEKKLMHFAGANNSLFILRNQEVIELKGDRQGISAATDLEKKPFGSQTVNIQSQDCVYLFTDGYSDQFGGESGKKFLDKRVRNLLLTLQGKSMETQKQILDKSFEDWRGEMDQVDDVLVIGFKIP
jgi:PAS domain S-box-containing protein